MNTSFLLAPLLGLLLCLGYVACKSDDPINQYTLNRALLQAVSSGNVALADSVLRVGADPNYRDDEGTPVLISAALTGAQPLVQRLVEEGAEINAKRQKYYRSTALMEISVSNDTTIARYLLDAGADVSMRDTFGDTALNWASYYGHVAFVQLLLKYGARLDVASKNGTALDVAVKQGHRDLISFFTATGAGRTLSADEAALVQAVQRGDLASVQQLLKTGVLANTTDPIGTPVLARAAVQDQEAMVRLLLQYQAPVNQQDRVGRTVLSQVAGLGLENMVRFLLAKGADPNLAGEAHNLTPMISAAKRGQAAVARILLDAGAQVDVQDGVQGYTPLMYATAYNHPPMVRVLLEAGANPYFKGFDGAELYDMVSFSNNSEINTIIQNYLMNQQ